MASCHSCGAEVPEGQTICSMCYGDPAYGSDGYYQAYLDECERQAENRRQEEESQPINNE